MTNHVTELQVPTFAEIYHVDTTRMPDYAQSSVPQLASELDELLDEPETVDVIDRYNIDELFGDSNGAHIQTYGEYDGQGIHPVARFNFPRSSESKGLLLISSSQPGRRDDELRIGFTGNEAVVMSTEMAEQLGVSPVFRKKNSRNIVSLLLPESEHGLTREASAQFKVTFGLGLEALKVAIKAKKAAQVEVAA